MGYHFICSLLLAFRRGNLGGLIRALKFLFVVNFWLFSFPDNNKAIFVVVSIL